MAAEHHFVTNWQIQGTAHEVAQVLGDPLGLARWWPSVYLGWAMARGEESRMLEVLRRRAKTEAERVAVPAPPGPTFARARR